MPSVHRLHSQDAYSKFAESCDYFQSFEDIPQLHKSHANLKINTHANASNLSLDDVARALPPGHARHRGHSHLSEASDSGLSDSGGRSDGLWFGGSESSSPTSHKGRHLLHCTPHALMGSRRRPPAVPNRSCKPVVHPRGPAMPTFSVAEPQPVQPVSTSSSLSHPGHQVHLQGHHVHQHDKQRHSRGVGYAGKAIGRDDESWASHNEDSFHIGLDVPEIEVEVIAGPGKGTKGRKITAEGWTTFG